MGRPRGSRNADYEQKRRRLARKVVQHLIAAPSEHLSLRELARAAGVSVSTMRHYFGDRDGILEASIAEMGLLASKHLQQAEDAARKAESPGDRLEVALRSLADAWRREQLGRAWSVGLSEGMYAKPGPAAVEHLMEPLVASIERVLGDSFGPSPRSAALALAAPLLMALTHQESLGGKDGRPLDVDALVTEHTSRFLRGWSAEA